MDCAEEVKLLKRELMPLVEDEDRLGFDLLNGKLTIDLESTDVTESDVRQAIDRTGLSAEDWDDFQKPGREQNAWQRYHRLILTSLSGIFGFLGLLLQLVSGRDGERSPR